MKYFCEIHSSWVENTGKQFDRIEVSRRDSVMLMISSIQ